MTQQITAWPKGAPQVGQTRSQEGLDVMAIETPNLKFYDRRREFSILLAELEKTAIKEYP